MDALGEAWDSFKREAARRKAAASKAIDATIEGIEADAVSRALDRALRDVVVWSIVGAVALILVVGWRR
jgi:hypothetical protein